MDPSNEPATKMSPDAPAATNTPNCIPGPPNDLAHEAHGRHAAPPQSTDLSTPFSTPSLHTGAWQTAPSHTPLAQSAALPHASPSPHGEHEPPQSAPLSPPLRTPSSHAGAWQTAPSHTPLAQSAPAPHALPSAQGSQAPPQSFAGSAPFCTPSSHAGARQTPPPHTPLTQSLATPHGAPSCPGPYCTSSSPVSQPLDAIASPATPAAYIHPLFQRNLIETSRPIPGGARPGERRRSVLPRRLQAVGRPRAPRSDRAP